MKNLYIVVLILFSFNLKASANEISGFAKVIDGDTIKILNKSIRLHGIDTPERKQKCFKESKEYNCGQVATNILKKKINNKQVVCKLKNTLDRYKRFIGVCFSQGKNLNKWLVRNGYAVAYRRYSNDYIKDEQHAKENKIGLWSGTFLQPEKWRKLN